MNIKIGFKKGDKVYNKHYPEHIVIFEKIENGIAICRERLGFGRRIELDDLKKLGEY